MPDLRNPLPPRGELCRIFEYDAEKGVLTWRHRPECDKRWNGRFAGTLAGRRETGACRYLTVSINRVSYQVHRIIFKMVYDEEPSVVDHKDRTTRNNRHTNLRAGDKSKNGANSKDRDRDLPRGVFLCSNSAANPYRAQFHSEHLGCFPTAQAAAEAFRKVQRERYGEFANA